MESAETADKGGIKTKLGGSDYFVEQVGLRFKSALKEEKRVARVVITDSRRSRA